MGTLSDAVSGQAATTIDGRVVNQEPTTNRVLPDVT
jgi:hypothetical protein